MNVVALIGDVIGSRKVGARAALQRRLETALAAATTAAGDRLASPYTLTLGDEFQAVYRRADTVLADWVGLLAAVHPVQMRVALGVGPLATRVNPVQALGMDGPAFHRAREAITRLKNDGGRLRVAGGDEAAWALANHALGLLGHHLQSWSQNRLRILAARLQGRAVRELEAELGITRVAIYKNIRAAALDEVVGLSQEISRALQAALDA